MNFFHFNATQMFPILFVGEGDKAVCVGGGGWGAGGWVDRLYFLFLSRQEPSVEHFMCP